MKLTEILHLCLVSKKTGIIHAETPSGNATLFLKDGEIIDARYQDHAGEEAFYRLSEQDECQCSLHEEDVEVERKIKHRTEFLLMEAARLLDEKSTGRSGQEEEEEPAPSGDVDNFELLYVTESEPIRHPIPEGRTLIGRARDCHIMLSNTTVSGRHAELINRDGKVVLTDLNSSNGTYVNSVRVSRSQPVQVNDQIQVGACLFEFIEKGSSGTLKPAARKTSVDLQDTRKFVLPGQQSHASLKPTVGKAFKEFQPVGENPDQASGMPGAMFYILIGLGAGAILILLVILLTRN